VSAFLYLISCGARNRFAALKSGLRSPRYLAALAVGAFYIWAFLIRPVNRGGATGPFLLGQPTEMIVTVLAVLTLMSSWIFGSDATALAFTPAEVSLLFPAPISRRALMGYKLFRSQIAVLVNSLIWVFVLRRGGSLLPGGLRAIAVWTLFSTLNLHRLGAALVRASWREHAGAGLRRHRVSIAAFVLVGLAVAGGIVQHRRELMTAFGAGGFFTALGDALASPPASWGLFPFHLVVAPTFAHSVREWALAIGPALLVLAFHAWWVLRTDAAFEDAAIEASVERARRVEAMKSRRTLGAVKPRKITSTIALAAVGHPAIGIFWKNMLCLRRTAQLRLLIGPTAMSIIIGGAIAGDEGGALGVIAASSLIFAGLLVVFGGRLIRNDLRQDMQHLPLLKTLPVASGDLMLAEVASGALPMAALQLVLLLVSYSASFGLPLVTIPHETRLAILGGAPFAVLALNGALLTIQNGTAVLFPTWIRLGPAANTGVEALGQNLLASVANLVSLAVALIVPAIVAVGAISVLGPPRAFMLTLLIIVASGVLATETYFALRLLGRAFAKAEPTASS
jgi:ABC-2 type transport system permease protein